MSDASHSSVTAIQTLRSVNAVLVTSSDLPASATGGLNDLRCSVRVGVDPSTWAWTLGPASLGMTPGTARRVRA